MFPLLDDGTVLFASVDLDEPDFEAAKLISELLPGTTWLERSRSGNYHVHAFFSEPIMAWVPRALMQHASIGAQKERVEIFPKQDRLREGMVGNYINLPYFGTERPVLSPVNWEPMPLDGFIEHAETHANGALSWERRAMRLGMVEPARRETREAGKRTEPHGCAAYIIRNADENPLQPGGRNIVLFNLAKMLADCQQFEPEEVFEYVQQVNEAGVEPLFVGEVRRIVGNAIRGGFTSTGCDDPIMAPYIDPDCKIANG